MRTAASRTGRLRSAGNSPPVRAPSNHYRVGSVPLLDELQLINFRNYELRKFIFSGNDVALTGPNGSGKTNVLESIGFLSVLRSFRNAGLRDLIRIGARAFSVTAAVNRRGLRERLCVRAAADGRRELSIGSARVRRASDFIREFRVVAFSPEDRELAAGSSGVRRRFFDMLIATVDPFYLETLARYNRALLQRNRALKLGSAAAALFEPELAEASPVITAARTRYAAALEEEVNRLLNGRGEFAIRRRGDEGDAGTIRRRLEDNRRRELARGLTLSGPQLDEFDFTLDGRLLRSFGSAGQIRIVTLMLRLAGYNLVRRSAAEPVAVLVDDVIGELDRSRLELFLETIQSADQRFYTFTTLPGLPRLASCEEIPAGAGQ